MTLPLAIRLFEAFDHFRGFKYGRSNSFPKSAGSLPPSLVGKDTKEIDCSSLSTYLLMHAYPDAGWTTEDYCQLQIIGSLATHPMGDSPMWCVERRGIGSRVGDFMAGCWHLVQTWNACDADGMVMASKGGHATIAYFDGALVHVLESTSKGRRGPQFRAFDPSRYHNKAVCHIARLDP